jgi:tetratricopeptide (TPR) repeat protein
VQAILLRSMIAAGERRFEDAIRDVEMILKETPDNVELQLQLAGLYMNDQRPRKAIALLTRIIEGDAGNWRALRTRADARLSIGQHKEAIADYEQALKLQPDDDSILNNLAWVLATSPFGELRDAQRSIQLGTKACELTDYEMPHILSTLAAGYAEAGDFETAIKWSGKAVELGRDELKGQLDQLELELKSYQKGEPWRELQEVKEKLDPPQRVIET